jgi:hypothetical protein
MSLLTELYGGRSAWLFTIWNTILYYDGVGERLSHGARHEHEPNVKLLTCGSQNEESAGALLLAERGGVYQALLCEPEGIRACRGGEEPTNFEFRTAGDSVHLVSGGRYLCAEPDGRVTLSRERAGDWERFTVALPKEMAAIAPIRVSDDLRAFVQHVRHRSPVEDAFIARTRSRHPNRRAVICDVTWLETYLTSEHHHFIRHLNEEHDFDVIDSANTDFANERTISELSRYELLLVAYQRFARIPVNALPSYIVIKIDDLENYNNSYTDLLRFYVAHADMLIGPCAYEFAKYFPHRNVKWLPYSTSIEDEGGPLLFNISPDERILVSGSVAADRPFRKYVFELDDSRLAKLAHPGYAGGYDEASAAIVKARWFREINKYLSAFCDAHSLRYIHLRVFEVASAGSLLLADRLVEAELNQLGFIDGYTCVFCDQSDFLEKVNWVLDPANRAKVDEIRAAGMSLALARHTTRRRAEEFAAIADAARRHP